MMAEIKKITKRDMFKELKELVSNRTDLVEFIDHELELLDRKATNRTQNKTQVENENIKEQIVKVLTEIGKPVTVTELQDANEDMGQFSNQKLSALLNQLVKAEILDKVVDKKKSYFTLKG